MKALNSFYNIFAIESLKLICQKREVKVQLINKFNLLGGNLKRVKSIFKYQTDSNLGTIPAVFTAYILMFVAHTSYGASAFPSNLVVNPESKGSVVWTGSKTSLSGTALRGLTPGQISGFGGMYFNCISSFSCNGWAIVDGYVGIPIADDILIVLQGSAYSSTPGEGVTASRGYDWTIRYTFTHQSIPNMTKAGGSYQASWNPTMITSVVTPPNTSGPHIYIQPTPSANTDPNSSSRYSYMYNWDITPSLYVGKKAKAGTYSLPQSLYASILGIDGRYPYPMDAPNYLLAGGSVTITDISCTISAPPTIDFGQVNITGVPQDGLLGVQKQGIDISCSPASSLVNEMRISFAGQFEGGYFGRLSVTDNSSGEVMGYIRGRYLDAGGLCAGDSQNEVGFNGVNKVKTINNVGGSSINIPITWSLCANNSGLLGEGSAQATVKVDWD